MSTTRIGTWGFGPHPWVSVERTRQFYARSLAPQFELIDADADPHATVDVYLSFASSRWYAAPRPCEAPIVLAMHGGPVIEHAHLPKWLPQLRTTDTLLVNCEADVEIIRAMCDVPPQLVVLPLPVDAEVFVPYDRADCRPEFGLASDDVVLGFVARLVPQKHLHGFLRVVAAVRDQLAPRPVRALVIGNFASSYPVLDYGCGEYVDVIKSLVHELGLDDALRYFSAKLSDEQLAAAYASMDVLVHPTQAIDENFGYVVVEALACGTPVVAAAYGGVRDSLIPGPAGALLPTWASGSGVRMDLRGAVAPILALLEEHDAELRDRATVHYAHTRYGFQRCAGILCDVLASACARAEVGEPVTITTRPPAIDRGLLPPSDPPYADFIEPIAHYVSHPCPTLRPDQRVVWAAGIGECDGELRLLDPTWPAALRLDPRDLELLDRCRVPTPASEFAEPHTDAWARLQGYVEQGLLIPEQRALRGPRA
ncbi:Glycosyltransferase MshA involved in mycothiol biosynthesis [Enhygromyxa salina]|uniref:Glycosyltransferase MshA involved in mycothiol biosynthesis n=1 Tax=Enhygromyxa salina TaxID=215803 RepID=A0A0C1ZLY7_9BACT|nr:glycosyltransferase family 4 protein [Enhygromyxa salina]KIG18519.1 Glycosyltransferase MshA involved in mycothiol biosynthesis [Enhygromyxa salina]